VHLPSFVTAELAGDQLLFALERFSGFARGFGDTVGDIRDNSDRQY
jgi:hypothetical protein